MHKQSTHNSVNAPANNQKGTALKGITESMLKTLYMNTLPNLQFLVTKQTNIKQLTQSTECNTSY